MKTYVGSKPKSGVVGTVVVIEGHEERPLPRITFHSPTGFSWGYHGSGPADLALSLLADYFGEQPRTEDLRGLPGGARWRCWALHQEFKRTVVAGMPDKRGWRCTDADLALWLAQPKQQEILARWQADFDAEVALVAELAAAEAREQSCADDVHTVVAAMDVAVHEADVLAMVLAVESSDDEYPPTPEEGDDTDGPHDEGADRSAVLGAAHLEPAALAPAPASPLRRTRAAGGAGQRAQPRRRKDPLAAAGGQAVVGLSSDEVPEAAGGTAR